MDRPGRTYQGHLEGAVAQLHRITENVERAGILGAQNGKGELLTMRKSGMLDLFSWGGPVESFELYSPQTSTSNIPIR